MTDLQAAADGLLRALRRGHDPLEALLGEGDACLGGVDRRQGGVAPRRGLVAREARAEGRRRDG